MMQATYVNRAKRRDLFMTDCHLEGRRCRVGIPSDLVVISTTENAGGDSGGQSSPSRQDDLHLQDMEMEERKGAEKKEKERD